MFLRAGFGPEGRNIEDLMSKRSSLSMMSQMWLYVFVRRMPEFSAEIRQGRSKIIQLPNRGIYRFARFRVQIGFTLDGDG